MDDDDPQLTRMLRALNTWDQHASEEDREDLNLAGFTPRERAIIMKAVLVIMLADQSLTLEQINSIVGALIRAGVLEL